MLDLASLDRNAKLQAALQLVQGEIERRKKIAADRIRLMEDLEEVRARCKTLHGFVKESWPILEPTAEFKDNWHLGAICDHLEAAHKGEISLLQINQPPGTMKSLTASVLFGAWEWGPGNKPGLRYLTASYREDWALRDSRKMRDLIISEWYQTLWPHVKLTRKGDGNFENTFRGGRQAVPFKSLTGGRGNRVIIDDPHSLDQAESEAERPATVRTFRESVPSRINDPINDAIIVMMQRMHPEDVCGVIEELGLPYVKLILPMEYIPSMTVKTPWFTDPRKVEGELLHPDRFPRDKLELKKIELGPHAYDTQFMQLPRARAGAFYFSEEHVLAKGEDGLLRPVPLPTQCDTVFAVIDTATKTKKTSDGTGATIFAYTAHPSPHMVVLDWEYVQLTADILIDWLPQILARVEEFARICGARYGGTGAWIEDKDSGQVLIQQAQKLGLPVEPIEATLTAKGKDGRALSVSGYIYQGMVKFSELAYAKSVNYKGRNANHALKQVTTFRIGVGTPNDEDELFDTFCYGAAIGLGDNAGV